MSLHLFTFEGHFLENIKKFIIMLEITVRELFFLKWVKNSFWSSGHNFYKEIYTNWKKTSEYFHISNYFQRQGIWRPGK